MEPQVTKEGIEAIGWAGKILLSVGSFLIGFAGAIYAFTSKLNKYDARLVRVEERCLAQSEFCDRQKDDIISSVGKDLRAAVNDAVSGVTIAHNSELAEMNTQLAVQAAAIAQMSKVLEALARFERRDPEQPVQHLTPMRRRAVDADDER